MNMKAQIGSFCRNYGSWKLYGKDKRDWNLELIDVMVNDMSPWWDHLSESFGNIFDYINRTIEMEIGKLASEVKGTQLR
jgi:hypothetical protein